MRPTLRTAALLFAVLSCACLAGRKSTGEVALKVDVPSEPRGFETALYQSLGVDLEAGNGVAWENDHALFEAMAKDLRKAKRDIHIVTFIWADGNASRKVLDAIAHATAHGAKCRVIIDAVGSLGFDEKPVEAAGCEVKRFRPVPGQDDLARNHRKLVIVDGRVGYIGGFGIDDKWLGKKDEHEWRDSNVRVEGPAVRAMQQAFAENWQEAGGELLPPEALQKPKSTGPVRAALVTSTGTQVITRADRLMQLLIAAAHERLWIANAYFVPSEPILKALAQKAKEGVDVRILTAGDKTDTKVYLPAQRGRIERLLQSGVRAFEYGPAMMHAKTVLVDDALFAVGSQNLDALSLNRLEEATLVGIDPKVAAELARAFEADLGRSRELRLQVTERRE